MAKINRRAVSIRATTYKRLHELANARELSGSGLLEMLIAREAEAAGIREFELHEVARPREPKRSEAEDFEAASGIFTF